MREGDAASELLVEANRLIEAGLGIGPLADPQKWNPRARAWLARFDSVMPAQAIWEDATDAGA